ncbi:DedA family protein [Crossiella sp. CA198]|uniref:DedA family protein n=1 Tax=Crossiella sp. CA198 TaxID=3455607 RepID=UPI003F8D4A68
MSERIGGIPGLALDLMEAIGAPGAALFVALDSFVVGFPGEAMLPMAGFAASQGRFSLLSALLWTTLGSLAGALAMYLIGRSLGRDRTRALVDRIPLMKATDFDRAETWFHRHGNKAVFFGRMLPLFRSVISLPAGIERMPLGRYLALTAAGSLVWNTVFILIGYVLGVQWELVEPYLDVFQYGVIAVLLVLLGYFVVSRVRGRGREKA